MITELLSFSHEKEEKLRDKLQAFLLQSHLLQRSCDEDIAGAQETRQVQTEAGREASPSQILQEVLRELWKCVVKPVLDGLALSVSSVNHCSSNDRKSDFLLAVPESREKALVVSHWTIGISPPPCGWNLPRYRRS